MSKRKRRKERERKQAMFYSWMDATDEKQFAAADDDLPEPINDSFYIEEKADGKAEIQNW
jgi:hypothetical protein